MQVLPLERERLLFAGDGHGIPITREPTDDTVTAVELRAADKRVQRHVLACAHGVN